MEALQAVPRSPVARAEAELQAEPPLAERAQVARLQVVQVRVVRLLVARAQAARLVGCRVDAPRPRTRRRCAPTLAVTSPVSRAFTAAAITVQPTTRCSSAAPRAPSVPTTVARRRVPSACAVSPALPIARSAAAPAFPRATPSAAPRASHASHQPSAAAASAFRTVPWGRCSWAGSAPRGARSAWATCTAAHAMTEASCVGALASVRARSAAEWMAGATRSG